jgi:hypothetical protein
VPITAEAVYRYLWNPDAFNSSTRCGGGAIEAEAAAYSRMGPARRGGRRGPTAWWSVMPQAPGCSSAPGGTEGIVSPQEAQDAFLLAFAARHYSGGPNASIPQAVADMYKAYFNISYLAVDGANNYGDNYLGTTLRKLLGTFIDSVESNNTNGLAAAAATCTEFAAENGPYVADLYLNSVLPLASAVPSGSPAAVFQAHAVTQTAISHFHLVAFDTAGRGAQAFLQGDVASATALVTQALAALDALLAVLRQGEGSGGWVGLYANEFWTWCWGSRAYASHLRALLAGENNAPPPPTIYPDYAFMSYEVG